jgi:hypothetical protein
MSKYALYIVLCLVFAGSFDYLRSQQNEYELNNERNIISSNEDSYFLGCVRMSRDFTYCKTVAKQYAEELRKNLP